MISPLLVEIAIGVAGPLLTTGFAVLNRKSIKALADVVPVVNKYSGVAKLALPMIDPEFAKHIDLITAVEGSLKRLSRGEATVPNGLSWVKRVSAKILDSESEMQRFLDALNEEFEATEFNKVNARTDGGYYRTNDDTIIEAA